MLAGIWLRDSQHAQVTKSPEKAVMASVPLRGGTPLALLLSHFTRWKSVACRWGCRAGAELMPADLETESRGQHCAVNVQRQALSRKARICSGSHFLCPLQASSVAPVTSLLGDSHSASGPWELSSTPGCSSVPIRAETLS